MRKEPLPQGRAGKRLRAFAIAGITLWVATFGLAFDLFMRWEATPGAKGGHPMRPNVNDSKGRWLIVLAAHTHCPCTRATLVNLEQLLLRYPARLACKIIFTGPNKGLDTDSENVIYARRLPDVDIEFVSEEQMEQQFKSLTSGQVYLYSPAGDLKFSGGLTNGRGFEGSSRGTKAVSEWIEGHAAAESFPVFGCPLQTPGSSL